MWCQVIFILLVYINTSGSYIINGEDANIEDFPYFARIDTADILEQLKHNGAGCIIHHQWILTAAHVVSARKQYRVVVGTDRFRKKPKKAIVSKIAKIIRYPGYNFSVSYKNDIALLYLTHPLNYSTVVKKIYLPPDPGYDDTEDAKIIGFGKNKTGHPASRLQKATIGVVRTDQCEEISRQTNSAHVFNRERMICAVSIARQQDTAPGDSGGPLIKEKDRDKHFVIGVTSVGVDWTLKIFQNSKIDRPSYYTRISFYLDWIKKTIKRVRKKEKKDKKNKKKKKNESRTKQ